MKDSGLIDNLDSGRPVILQYEYSRTDRTKPVFHAIVIVGKIEQNARVQNYIVQDEFYAGGDSFITLQKSLENNVDRKNVTVTNVKLKKLVFYKNNEPK